MCSLPEKEVVLNIPQHFVTDACTVIKQENTLEHSFSYINPIIKEEFIANEIDEEPIINDRFTLESVTTSSDVSVSPIEDSGTCILIKEELILEEPYEEYFEHEVFCAKHFYFLRIKS